MKSEKEIKRLYWSTKQAAAEIGVNPSCISYWCKQFPFRKGKGHYHAGKFIRLYNADEIKELRWISEQRQKGFSINDIRLMRWLQLKYPIEKRYAVRIYHPQD